MINVGLLVQKAVDVEVLAVQLVYSVYALHFLSSIKFINLHLVWCFHVVYIFRLLCLMMTFHSRKRL